MKGAKEFTARSLDEAIASACSYFDLPREKLEVESVNDAKSGIFGLVGAKKAKILAKQAIMEGYSPDFKGRAEAIDEDKASKQSQRSSRSRGDHVERKPREHSDKQRFEQIRPESDGRVNAGESPASTGEMQTAERQSQEDRPARGQRGGRQNRQPRARKDGRSDNRRDQKQAGAESRQSSSGARKEDTRRQPRPGRFDAQAKNNISSAGNNSENALPRAGDYDFPVDFDNDASNSESFANLDKDKAFELTKLTLEKIVLPICPEAKIDVQIDERRISASIDCGDASGLIIGREGQTLSALQYMASRIVSRQMDTAVHVHLDTGDYKERQDSKLRDIAARLAQRARETGRTQYTRPLSSYHRRIVHMVLQNEEGIETRSKGDGSMKRVYIFRRSN